MAASKTSESKLSREGARPFAKRGGSIAGPRAAIGAFVLLVATAAVASSVLLSPAGESLFERLSRGAGDESVASISVALAMGARRSPSLPPPRPLRARLNIDYHHECQGLVPMDEAAAWQLEWSRDRWRHQHCKDISEGIAALNASRVEGTPKKAGRRTVLFVDAREECERYREFLLKVRRTGYGGDIVFMVYYGGDAERCRAAGIETDFAPLSIHYHPAPRWEVTLFQYHGVTSYFRANPSALLSYEVAGVVRPDFVEWCSSPFEHIPSLMPLPTGDAASALRDDSSVGGSRIVYAMRFAEPRRADRTLRSEHRSRQGAPIVNDDLLISAPMGIYSMMSKVLRYAMARPLTTQEPSWSALWSAPSLEAFRAKHLRFLPDIHSGYFELTCLSNAPLRCRPASTVVRIRHRHCFRETAGQEGESTRKPLLLGNNITEAPEPIDYSPFCYMPYRGAVSEVPRDGSISLQRFTVGGINEGVFAINNALTGTVNDVYSSPSAEEVRSRVAAREWGGFSDRCPHGKMAVLSMTGSYILSRVEHFITSFLQYTYPHCTRLVLLVQYEAAKAERWWEAGVVNVSTVGDVAASHSHRIELVFYTEDAESTIEAHAALGLPDNAWSNALADGSAPEGRPLLTLVEVHEFRGKSFVDLRFEVAREWLERNYKDYRYASNIDSRDLILMGDPLQQLVKVLGNSAPVDGSVPSYLDEEFIGAISEAYPLGSYSTLLEDAAYSVHKWTRLCGPRCFSYLARQSFTNGEPLAIINSGSLIGTTIGLLKYYRFHVRLSVESRYDFSTSDQGIFTFYCYALLADTKYPHRILALHSSRSGFANPVHFDKITRRRMADGVIEHAMEDCTGQRVVQVHQADRWYYADKALRQNLATLVPAKRV